MKKAITFSLAILSFIGTLHAQFVWRSGESPVLSCSPDEHVMVQTTLDILSHDCHLVLGKDFTRGEQSPQIIVGTAGVNPLLSGMDLTPLKGKKEAFMHYSNDNSNYTFY